METRFPRLRADSLPAEPQGKPMYVYIYKYIHIKELAHKIVGTGKSEIHEVGLQAGRS